MGWAMCIVFFSYDRTYETVFVLCFRFSNKEDATQAIVSVHGSEIAGHTVKCSWGKESSDPSPPTQASQQAGGAPGGQVGVHYVLVLHA